MDFKPGDIVRRKPGHATNNDLRYVVRECRNGWASFAVAKKDGTPDRNWMGFSADAERFELADMTQGPLS